MKRISDLLRERLYKTSAERDSDSYEALYVNEWSYKFEQLMRNRLVIGALRYGKLNTKGKPNWDRLGYIKLAVELYKTSGNDEHLVDIANMALLEFEEGKHPDKHFKADDDGQHVRRS